MIREKRCSIDPLYNSIYYPQIQDTLKTLVRASIEIVKKKYSMEQNKMFDHLVEFDDDRARLVALIFFLAWEPEVKQLVEKLYKFDSPDSIFADPRQHFHQFLIKINAFVDDTIRFRFVNSNIAEIFANFEEGVKTQYLMGPYN